MSNKNLIWLTRNTMGLLEFHIFIISYIFHIYLSFFFSKSFICIFWPILDHSSKFDAYTTNPTNSFKIASVVDDLEVILDWFRSSFQQLPNHFGSFLRFVVYDQIFEWMLLHPSLMKYDPFQNLIIYQKFQKTSEVTSKSNGEELPNHELSKRFWSCSWEWWCIVPQTTEENVMDLSKLMSHVERLKDDKLCNLFSSMKCLSFIAVTRILSWLSNQPEAVTCTHYVVEEPGDR